MLESIFSEKIQVLRNKKFYELTDEERGLLLSAEILEDSKQENVISLRDYCFFRWDKPSYLLKIIKPYLNEIDKELRKRGFVRVSKYTWRKFVLTINKKQLKRLAKELNLSKDEAYLLSVAYELLKITVPYKKDWKGYNIVDGFRIMDIFQKLEYKGTINKKDIKYIGRKLMKYEEQIRGLGLDFERVKKTVQEILQET